MTTKTLRKIGQNHFIVYPAQKIFMLKKYSFSSSLLYIQHLCVDKYQVAYGTIYLAESIDEDVVKIENLQRVIRFWPMI